MEPSESPESLPTAPEQVEQSELEHGQPVDPSQPLHQQLQVAAEACGIVDIEPSKYQLLASYCRELWDWNEKINLTRHTTPELFVNRDWLDTVKLAAQLAPNEKVLDFGSGSGVPGMTVAILRPDLKVTLCDSVQKKAKVLEDIAKKLKLPIHVYGINVKDVLEAEKFDTLTSRAVGSVAKMLTWFKPYWHRFDRLVTVKGPNWVEERGEARHLGLLSDIQLRKLDEYAVPGHDSASVILQLNKKKPGSA